VKKVKLLTNRKGKTGSEAYLLGILLIGVLVFAWMSQQPAPTTEAPPGEAYGNYNFRTAVESKAGASATWSVHAKKLSESDRTLLEEERQDGIIDCASALNSPALLRSGVEIDPVTNAASMCKVSYKTFEAGTDGAEQSEFNFISGFSDIDDEGSTMVGSGGDLYLIYVEDDTDGHIAMAFIGRAPETVEEGGNVAADQVSGSLYATVTLTPWARAETGTNTLDVEVRCTNAAESSEVDDFMVTATSNEANQTDFDSDCEVTYEILKPGYALVFNSPLDEADEQGYAAVEYIYEDDGTAAESTDTPSTAGTVPVTDSLVLTAFEQTVEQWDENGFTDDGLDELYVSASGTDNMWGMNGEESLMVKVRGLRYNTNATCPDDYYCSGDSVVDLKVVTALSLADGDSYNVVGEITDGDNKIVA
jgi:hypothetical protein